MSLLVQTGNRCGHDPKICRTYTRPSDKKKLPSILQQAMKTVAQVFWFPAKYLPRLREANGKDSQQRTERREAEVRVFQFLFNYCDLATFEVGTPFKEKQGLNYMRTGRIAEKTGLSIKAVQRALTDLERVKYITITRKVISLHDGLSQVNKISVARRAFLDLGFSNEFIETSRHYKYKSNVKQGRISPVISKVISAIGSVATSALKQLPSQLQKQAKGVKSAADMIKYLASVNEANAKAKRATPSIGYRL